MVRRDGEVRKQGMRFLTRVKASSLCNHYYHLLKAGIKNLYLLTISKTLANGLVVQVLAGPVFPE